MSSKWSDSTSNDTATTKSLDSNVLLSSSGIPVVVLVVIFKLEEQSSWDLSSGLLIYFFVLGWNLIKCQLTGAN